MRKRPGKKRKRASQGKCVTLNEYQRLAQQTDQNAQSGLDGLAFALLGLFGEVGTLLSALKKKRRDRDSFVGYHDAIVEEFGDTLWYFSNIASRARLNLSVLAQRVFREIRDWDEVGDDAFGTFSDIQEERDEHGSDESPAFQAAITSLAGKVGLLLNDHHQEKFLNNRDALSAHLVEIFRALINAADIADIDLEEAAATNMAKIHSRWPVKKQYTPLFDTDFDAEEQLPRVLKMNIIERKAGHRTFVIQQCNGINIGSSLTDNRLVDDDYRFHDVFHLAYAAILGWSPVLRALFKLKRKSKPKIDEAEDGARAILIEEGISTLIFHRAHRLNYFESINSLDYSLLKLIPEFVRGYEVEACPLWQWEKAVLDGFAIFRQLRQFRRGTVIADLRRRKITFKRLK